MTKPQIQAFEKEMSEDKDLQNEVQLGKEVNQAIKQELQVSDFMNKIGDIHTQEFEKPKNKIINMQNKWYWAAASITLFSGTAYFSIQKRTTQPEYLFNQYYEVWQPALITRSANSNVQKQILMNFEQGNYNKVLMLIETIPAEEQNDAKLILTKGCALMEIEEYNKAIVEFEKFNTKDFTLYTDASNWYKALCYIKLQQLNKAMIILNNIVIYKSAYSDDAKKLLDKIS